MSPATHSAVEPPSSEAAVYALREELSSKSGQLIPFLWVTAGYLVTGTLCLGAGIITARRLAGGLVGPLPIGGLLTVAWAGIGLIVVVDQANLSGTKSSGWLSRASLLLMLVMLGVWYPLSPTETLMTVALLSAVTALVALPSKLQFPASLAYLLQRDHQSVSSYSGQKKASRSAIAWLRHQLAEQRLRRTTQKALLTASPPDSSKIPLANFRNHSSPAFNGQLLQWQERYRSADGKEFLRGKVVVQLSAGTRLATGHVGFCPAFEATPIVEVQTDYDSLEVVVEAAEVLPWGTRVECRIEDAADESVGIPVELTVSLPTSSPNPSALPPLPTD